MLLLAKWSTCFVKKYRKEKLICSMKKRVFLLQPFFINCRIVQANWRFQSKTNFQFVRFSIHVIFGKAFLQNQSLNYDIGLETLMGKMVKNHLTKKSGEMQLFVLRAHLGHFYFEQKANQFRIHSYYEIKKWATGV